MLFKKNFLKGSFDFIVVGLGNPGKKYERTRHNVGFRVIDYLCEKHEVSSTRKKFDAICAKISIGGKNILLLKPQTFMNNSGLSVAEAANFFKVSPENIIVVFDDISLSPGKLRVKRKGTAGGHNGVKSIIKLLGSEDFPRVKIGVGKKPNPNWDLANWVLSRFSESEDELIDQAVGKAYDALKYIIDDQIDKAMNLVN